MCLTNFVNNLVVQINVNLYPEIFLNLVLFHTRWNFITVKVQYSKRTDLASPIACANRWHNSP